MGPEPDQAEVPGKQSGHRYGSISIYGNAPVHLGDTYISNPLEDSDEHKRPSELVHFNSRLCRTQPN